MSESKIGTSRAKKTIDKIKNIIENSETVLWLSLIHI